MDRPKSKSVGPKSKRWKELQSRRSFRSANRFRAPCQYNRSSFMHDPPVACQNAKEKSNEIYTNMSAEDKDVVFSKIFNDSLVDKRTLVEENPKEIRIVNHYRFDEEYRKCGFDIGKDRIQDACEDKEEQRENGNKAVRWTEDDEKSLMDLGISEVERTKRLESLMARRRSRKPLSFQLRRNGTGNNSCSQISSLHIPKTNPFLAKGSGDPTSAPSYMVKSNPFDLPYDPHEEKPILTGDSFQEEFMATHPKEAIFCRHERISLGNFLPPESTNDKHKTSFGSDFAIKQLTSGRLGTSTLEKKEDDDKQPQRDSSIPNDDNHTKEEGESSEKVVGVPDEAAGIEAAEKVVGVVDVPDEAAEKVADEAAGTEADTKEQEVHHDVSSDQSSWSSSSSEDEPILRPNKEAILHCLSMSRMRVISEGNNFQRHAESFDCGPSALFDKTKTDCFFFGGNKRNHYPSTYSVASDMQVEVSEIGSPSLTNISSLDDEASIHDMDMEKGKGSVVNSTNPSEMDVNDTRLRDIDVVSEQGTIESGFSRQDLDPEKTAEQDRLLAQDPPSTWTCEMDNEVPNQDTEDCVVKTETKSLVHPPPSDMQVSVPTSSSINQSSSTSREMDGEAQVTETEMEQGSKRYEQRAEEAPITSSPMYVLQPKLLIAEDIEGDLDGLEVETQSLFPPSPPVEEEVDMGRLPVSAPASMASSPKSTSQHVLSVDPSSMSTHVMDNEAPNEVQQSVNRTSTDQQK